MGKNRSGAYVGIVESTCNFRRSQPEGQLRQTPEKRKSLFHVSLPARDRTLFCPFRIRTAPGLCTRLVVATERLRTDGNCGFPAQRAAEIVVALRNDYCVCSHCGVNKRGFRKRSILFVRIRRRDFRRICRIFPRRAFSGMIT